MPIEERNLIQSNVFAFGFLSVLLMVPFVAVRARRAVVVRKPH